MNETLTPLKQSAFLALEEWGMMMLEENAPDIKEWNAGEYFIIKAQFSGPSDGVLHIVSSQEFAHALAQNVLGENSETPFDDALYIDTLKELANITLAHYLVLEFGANTYFELPVFTGERRHDANFNLSEKAFSMLGDDAPFALDLVLQ